MRNELELTEFFEEFSNNCKNVQKKFFQKSQIITSYIQKRNQICVLLTGEADLVRYDLNGGKSIIEHYTKNDIFGEAFYIVTVNNELLVEAKKNCEVLFFSYPPYLLCKVQFSFRLPELLQIWFSEPEFQPVLSDRPCSCSGH